MDKISPFPTWPCPDDDEVAATTRVLRSGRLNYWSGDEGRLFESEFAEFVGVSHAVAVANGTVALELALYSLGIGTGDEVIVPSRTFIATASAVVARGATPIVADVHRDSQNLTADTIRACLTGRTRAIIVVHLAGWPCDMDAIRKMANGLDLPIVEDCAQAHGAVYKGKPVGSFGDVAAFSFCQDKIMTTAGEGGMLVTSRGDLWERAWSYKDHGKNRSAVEFTAAGPDFRWLHESFGSNFRLTEVQSAIGRVALRRLPQSVSIRRQNAYQLTQHLLNMPLLRTPTPSSDYYHSYYKLYTFVRPDLLREGWSRDRILGEIAAAGVPCGVGSCPEIYREKAFGEPLRPRVRHRVARELGDTSLMFLVHPTLTQQHIERVADVIGNVIRRATKPASTAAGSTRCA